MLASRVHRIQANHAAQTSARPSVAPRTCRFNVRAAAVPASKQQEESVSPAAASRRAALALGGAALLAPVLFSPGLIDARAAFAAPAVDFAQLRAVIKDLISDPKSVGGIGEKGPTLVRLAWHSSGTYDKMSKTGGSGGGTMYFKEELAHGANAGLEKATQWLEPLKKKYPGVSYADLYTLGGAVSVEAMGGPAIAWRAGRVDALDPSAVTPDGRLPDADKGSPPKTAAALRTVFGRMGFDDREIVVLSGAHALGRCHADASGYVGPWTPTPTIFSNLYYKLLLKTNWTPDPRQKMFQFQDPTGTLMMLPSDLVLIQDDKFKKYVEVYAKDKKLFYKDFSKSFAQLLELGTSGLVAV
ncbi:hypothetical protein FOA52_008152 [Chlamydomonas sp. UWO 241]|nr:hypothetical protein FOA52_008152 [Chlamydomonas sp. UWO 241]